MPFRAAITSAMTSKPHALVPRNRPGSRRVILGDAFEARRLLPVRPRVRAPRRRLLERWWEAVRDAEHRAPDAQLRPGGHDNAPAGGGAPRPVSEDRPGRIPRPDQPRGERARQAVRPARRHRRARGSYQPLGNGSDAVTSGVPALPPAQLEAETNRLERYPVGTDMSGGCVVLPRDLFVTFANSTQRASVAYSTGCAVPPSNRVLLVHPTTKWLHDLENFTDHSLTPDDITGTWRPVSIAGYHGPLHSPPLALAPSMAFDGADKWAGSDGCNYMSGSYRIGARNAIRFTEVSTKRRCAQTPPPDPLQRAARIELDDDRLKLFGPAGRQLAEYELVNLLGPPVAKR